MLLASAEAFCLSFIVMARKSIIARNKKRMATVEKYAEKRRALKEAGDYEALHHLPRNASPTRVRNRSFLSGRARSFMRKFGLDRIEFRELANQGKIPGVRKSSW